MVTYNEKTIFTALKQALASEELVIFAYLFGSYVAREQSPLSDIDIAVYPVKKLDLDERLGFIQRLGKKTKMDNLDLAFLDRLTNLHILEAIITHGKVLVDKNPDLREYFEVMTHHKFLDFQYQRKLYMDELMSTETIEKKRLPKFWSM